jgi:hypothetical protein
VKVHCYVLMESHFHLVAKTPEGNLSTQVRTEQKLVNWPPKRSHPP